MAPLTPIQEENSAYQSTLKLKTEQQQHQQIQGSVMNFDEMINNKPKDSADFNQESDNNNNDNKKKTKNVCIRYLEVVKKHHRVIGS